ADFGHGDLGVDAPDRFADGIRARRGVVLRTDDEGPILVGAVSERYVDHGGGLFAEIKRANVADDANDLNGLFIGIPATEELAHGILVVPGDTRCAFRDDSDVFAEVIVSKKAAGEQR